MWWKRLISWSKDKRDVKWTEICRSRNRWTKWCFAAPRHWTAPFLWKDQPFHPHKPHKYYQPRPLYPLNMTFCFLLFFFIRLTFLSQCVQQLRIDDRETDHELMFSPVCGHISSSFFHRDTKRVLGEQLCAGIAQHLFCWSFCFSEYIKKHDGTCNYAPPFWRMKRILQRGLASPADVMERGSPKE